MTGTTLQTTESPTLPGLPAGWRWVVKKNRWGWHIVCLEQWNGRKWKNKGESKVFDSRWTDVYAPSADDLPKCIQQTAQKILDRHEESVKLKTISKSWVGVYESRKV